METLILGIYIFSFLFYLLACFLKSKFFPSGALLFLCLGFLGNFYLSIKHFFQTYRLPLTNTSETLLVAVSIIVLIYLILEFRKRQLKIVGLGVSLISCLGLIGAFGFFKRPLTPLLPALQSRWLVFHVSSCIIAYGFFTIAFVIALVYVFKKVEGLRLVAIMHRCVCIGFLFLTLGIILGSLWGKSAWGHWWNWDPKETWALITWLIYASYIHSCLLGNRSDKKLVAIAILGFLTCLFTYLGVNYLLRGLHSYA